MYKIKFIRGTTCLMLTKNNIYIDSLFIKEYDYIYGNLTLKDIEKEARELLKRHKLQNCVIDLSAF